MTIPRPQPVPALLAAATLWACLASGAALADPPRRNGFAGTEHVANCSWDNPGHTPFMGDVVAAVDRYADIPADVRQRLKARMAARQYDEVVSIRRDSIEGRKSIYEPRIRDMHFADNRVCGEVSRSQWTAQMQERGLVYCEGDECVLVPTVCRNVSRIARAPGAMVPPVAAAAPPDDELLFEPPGAGVPPGAVGEAPAGAAAADPLAAGGAASFDDLTQTLPTGAGPINSGPSIAGTPYAPIVTPPSTIGGPAHALPAAVVPEPSAWLLLLAGIGVIGAKRRFGARRAG